MSEAEPSCEPPTDSELMFRIAGHDQDALEELYNRYSSLVYTICHRICGDFAESQAVTTEVFWEIWQNAGKFDPQRGRFRTYLAMMSRSRAIDRCRSADGRASRTHQSIETVAAIEMDHSGDPSSDFQKIEDRDLVRGALAGLEEDQRNFLTLAFFDGLTHREIAEAVNAPLGTVKSKIRKGLQQLKMSLRHIMNEKSY